ncbi:MAG: hypothetical protein ACRDWH_09860 [Acidimicrobiia bacterium]
MLGRKLLALAMLVVLLLAATAVQAAPPQTEWSVVADLNRVFTPTAIRTGHVTFTQAADGTVSLSFDVTFTWECLDGAPSVERWTGSATSGVTLTVAKNLSSAAAASGVFGGGYSRTSTCLGDVADVAIGEVTFSPDAISKTERERTADGVRVLTRPASGFLMLGSIMETVSAEIVKEIG